jgi:hydrogenase maturation protease
MARVLVLGYGNPLRSDDRLGWQVAVELFRTNTSPEVEVLPCHQLTPELAEPASIADTVLFIDCTRDGQPGEVRCEELRPQSDSGSLTHDLTPSALLALTSELYGFWPKAYLLSIRGECYEPGDSFSAPVTSRVPELRKMARRLIEESLATAGSAR